MILDYVHQNMIDQNSFFWAYEEMFCELSSWQYDIWYASFINTWAKLHLFDIIDISYSENT